MNRYVVLLSIPGLREQDLPRLPRLAQHMSAGALSPLVSSFPCVTWPVQANMLTGQTPDVHGVIANGFFWRDLGQVEMWTAWNDKIAAPQIWDRLHQLDPNITSAVWFPMLSKGCGADFICMPAPIHNPDGSEDLWCYSRPTELYGELRDRLGHFPLQHFWGPLAGIPSTAWIVESAIVAAERFQPNFFYLYLPHLDYAAQRHGPDSEPAGRALDELDRVLGRLFEGFAQAYREAELVWIAASEYAIVSVNHVSYPNRTLRENGWLAITRQDDGEHLDLHTSNAWALVDHQFSHVFVRDADAEVTARVAALFRGREGIDQVLVGPERARYHLDHPRSGDVILVSAPNSWQAYYWWSDDAMAPSYARSVDIHRKPGYDPVELFVEPATRSIPLDATLVHGSHGAPVRSQAQRGVLLASRGDVLPGGALADTGVARLVLQQFA